MKRILLLSFFVVGLLIASEPGAAGSASGAVVPTNCPICMQPVDLTLPADGSKAAIKTTPLFGCTHPEHFHASCLAKYLQTSGTQAKCPLCLKPLQATSHTPGLPTTIKKVIAKIPLPVDIIDIKQIDSRRYNSSGKILDLSNAPITNIAGRVFAQINSKWPDVARLSLNNTPLAELSPDIRQLRNLRVLSVVSTPLRALPSEIWHMNLDDLNLMGSSIESLPLLPVASDEDTFEAKSIREKLQQLMLSLGMDPTLYNTLELPRKTTSLQESLRQLTWSRSPVVPKEIGSFQNLESLSFILSRATTLPPEIGQLRKLKRLFARNSSLQTLPPEIGRLDSLEQLDLKDTWISELPDTIVNLHRLRELVVGGTPLIHQDDWLKKRADLQERLPNLTIIDE